MCWACSRRQRRPWPRGAYAGAPARHGRRPTIESVVANRGRRARPERTASASLLTHNVRMSCVPGLKASPPVALPTPRAKVSTEVHDCSMRLLGCPLHRFYSWSPVQVSPSRCLDQSSQ